MIAFIYSLITALAVNDPLLHVLTNIEHSGSHGYWLAHDDLL